MSSEQSYRDIELIRKYYNGQLNETEKNALEQRAMDEPFLKEAMEGFDENPSGFNQFSARHLKSNTSVSRTMFIAAACLGLMALAVVVLNNSYENTSSEEVAVQADSLNDELEVELVPIALETLIVAAEADQITADEMVESSARYRNIVTDPEPTINEPEEIEIPEAGNIEDQEFEIEQEGNSSNLVFSCPATFMYDLYVADYRHIQRKGSNIEYTRYEMSGLDASFESDSARQSTDLIEKKVEIPYVDYLDKSMHFFSRGKYKKALGRYFVILEQYPDDINALFYGGLAYYNLKQYDEALGNFESVFMHPLKAFNEESKWYMAKSLLKLDRKNDAIKLLDEIIGYGGFYTEDAIRLKKSL